jgi:MSHA biogenesis protein MshO
LGIPGADVYAGENVATLTVGGNALNHLSMRPKNFRLASPGNRFFIVQHALSYVCDTQQGQLLLYPGYAMQNAQPTSLATLNALNQARVVVDHVVACSMEYTPGVLQSNGIVRVILKLAQNSSVVQLYKTFNVLNSP